MTPPRARRPAAALLLALAALALPACRALTEGLPAGPDWIAVDTRTDRRVDLDHMARDLAGRDVVFLGELHDSPTGHELQLRLLRRLAALRPQLVLSLEMFERDVQPALDAWLAGTLSEQEFLAEARPWPRYAGDYRPLVAFARERGIPVIAANIPRPLAARTANEGLATVLHEPHVPWPVTHGAGAYSERFAAAMADHGGADAASMERFFAAQALKDETMAVSLLEARDAAPRGPRPLLVHVCGRFHSDHRLGTVERLLGRRPELDVGVVSMRRGSLERASLTADDRAAADYLWLVRR